MTAPGDPISPAGAATTIATLVPWAALVTAAVSFAVALGRHTADARNRRRDVYSAAYRTVMEWTEMVYRVRRRDAGAVRGLIDHAHEIQERISYYEGWLASESVSLRNSYCLFVESVKNSTGPLISEAWQQPGRAVGEQTGPDDKHPDVAAASAAFLKDVRSHLSLQPWRRIWLGVRRRLWPAAMRTGKRFLKRGQNET